MRRKEVKQEWREMPDFPLFFNGNAGLFAEKRCIFASSTFPWPTRRR
jgi:hypothetical protein